MIYDLQLFAEEEETEEESQEETEEETQEEETEQEPEKEPEQEPEENEEEKEDKIPLAKYMEEKKKRQAYEKRLSSIEEEQEKTRLKESFLDRGYFQDEAERLADERIKSKAELDQIKDKQIDYEISDLSKTDSFYSDALSWKDEIKQKMKKLNIPAEEAYMLLRGKTRVHEIKTQSEQLNLAKRREAEGKRVENAEPGPAKDKYKLDETDRKALNQLQKAQPDAGWTAEKYWKMMKQQE